MSQPFEQRIAAALDARAEQVTADDLRPLEVPRGRPGFRPSATVALVSAAAVAVIAAAFAIGRIGDWNTGPAPAVPPTTTVPQPPTPTPPTTTSESPPVREDFVVADRQRADVDGDGQPDDVRLMLHTRPDGTADGLLDLTLATGETLDAQVPRAYPPRLLPAFDVNRDGHQQLLLSQTAGGDEAQLLVYTWLDGALVRADNDTGAPLALGLDGEGKYADHYTDAQGLFSWLRKDPVDRAAHVFRVDLWSWTIDGDQLIAAPAGQGCVDVTSQDVPGSCGQL